MIKIKRSGEIRLAKRKIRNAIMPMITKPTSSLVVVLQRGEDGTIFSSIKDSPVTIPF
jgi:hypothetical protein